MSAMREAFDTWWKKMKPAEVDEFKEHFEECWQAAIEHVKAQGAIMWSITINGEHSGNAWLSEYTAGTKMDELNRAYPNDARTLVPLYRLPEDK